METKSDDIIIDLLVSSIIEHINKNPKISKYFDMTYKTQKYKLTDLLPTIVHVLKQGISWRFIKELKNPKNIHWNTFYKMHVKLIKLKVYTGSYENLLNAYYKLEDNKKNLLIRSIDSTNIINKQGIEKVKYNKAYPKHKISKLSAITDNNKNVINIGLFDGNMYDSKICKKQINSKNRINIKAEEKFRNILLGDTAYDSNKIRKILKNKKYSRLICPKNKRNTKDKEKLKKLEMNKKDKKIFKNRIKVEHIFNMLKKNKRLAIRYDKQSETFLGFVFLALIYDFIKRQ
jgi:transposase